MILAAVKTATEVYANNESFCFSGSTSGLLIGEIVFETIIFFVFCKFRCENRFI
jgi:hypothetical protein